MKGIFLFSRTSRTTFWPIQPPSQCIQVKGKAHPLQAMQAQRGLGELRLLDFLTTALCGGSLSALRTDRLYPKGYSWYSLSLGAESAPGPWFGRKESMHTVYYFQGVQRHRHEGNTSPPPCAEVKNEWNYTSPSPYASMACTGTTLPFYEINSSIPIYKNSNHRKRKLLNLKD